MNVRRLFVVLAVLAISILALPAFSEKAAGPVTGAAKSRAQQIQDKRVTQAEREAAAAARKKIISQQGAKPAGAKLALEPVPGGVPDYVTTLETLTGPTARR